MDSSQELRRSQRVKNLLNNNDSSETVQKSPFLFKRQKIGTPASEPIPVVSVQPPKPPGASVVSAEQIIPLNKDDMLRILSKEMPLDKASIIQTFMTNSRITNERVPSIYSSYFFRKDIIKNFQREVINNIPSNKLASYPLSTYNLYNKDDILNNTTFRPDILGSRIIEKTSGYTAASSSNMTKFINFLSQKICSEIGGKYAKTAVQRAIDLVNNENEFDILIASTKVIEDVTLPMENRLAGVVAFIIVELGECHKYPASYSINLICTDTSKAVAGTGSLLMGAFLYTILSHPINTRPTNPIRFPQGKSFLSVTSKRLQDGSIIENCTFGSTEPLIPIQHVAVLELAQAYINTGGLCMYEKYGFTYDQTMFSDDTTGVKCFDDRDNLPMIIDFTSKQGYAELDIDAKKNKIINIAAGNEPGFQKSKICSIRGDQQRLLGYLKSIKLYLDNTAGSSLDDFLRGSVEGVLVKQLKTINQNPTAPRGRKATGPPPQEGSLDEFINYLENPPQPPDPVMQAKVERLITFLPKIKTAPKPVSSTARVPGGGTRKKNKFNKRKTKRHH